VARSVQEIEEGIVERISRLTGVPPGEIDVREPILRYGLDSVAVVAFAADLQEWLGVRLRENPLNEETTIETLARFLAEHAGE
jgi:acyl carrier protein